MGEGGQADHPVSESLIELTEYVPTDVPEGDLSKADVEAIDRVAGNKVVLDAPGPRTGWKWRLTPQGWVGFVPVREDLMLHLRPRVCLGNIFRMLEYAYRLRQFELLPGIVGSESLQDFYERLAAVLAKRVLERSRRGLYRAYIGKEEAGGAVRGRIDVKRALSRPWDTALPCEFQEHTADIEENQILVRTLAAIARGGMCTERVSPLVRRAYRSVIGMATDQPLTTADCIGRLYNRLNGDYQPMHALCRFFLEHAGPTHSRGSNEMIPFLVEMPRLFELFVAEWLRVHLPPGLLLEPQYKMTFGRNDEVEIHIDLLLTDAASGRPLWILDTKYKVAEKASSEDIQQVVAYAAARGAARAGLIYPTALSAPLGAEWGQSGVTVRSLAFELGGDLEEAGQRLLGEITAAVRS